jgi:hypothetical protein|eukprot:COSAG02_NODE_121_length_35326_cov_25.450819_23_plen_248_part_00
MERSKRTQASLSLGDIEEQELLLTICSHLNSPRDLGRLACVSRAFGTPVDWTIAMGRAPLTGQRMLLKDMTYMDLRRKAVAMGVMQHEIPAGKDDLGKMVLLSVVNESARRWVLRRQPKGKAVPRGSNSWLRRMYEIQEKVREAEPEQAEIRFLRGWLQSLSEDDFEVDSGDEDVEENGGLSRLQAAMEHDMVVASADYAEQHDGLGFPSIDEGWHEDVGVLYDLIESFHENGSLPPLQPLQCLNSS